MTSEDRFCPLGSGESTLVIKLGDQVRLGVNQQEEKEVK